MVEAGLPLIECALQVGDFGDAINWPTPGEIAHKSVQVSLWEGWAGLNSVYMFTFGLKLSEPQLLPFCFFKRSGWYHMGNIEIAKNHSLRPCCVSGTAKCCFFIISSNPQ